MWPPSNEEGLFREPQDELDRKITVMADRDTPRFRHGSLQLYGAIEDDLLEQAEALLAEVPSGAAKRRKATWSMHVPFAARADEEITHLRGEVGGLPATVRVRSDVSSLMFSRSHRSFRRELRFPPGA